MCFGNVYVLYTAQDHNCLSFIIFIKLKMLYINKCHFHLTILKNYELYPDASVFTRSPLKSK